MFDQKMQRYKQDYVYAQAGTGELCNVEIIGNIEGETLNFKICTEIEMSKEDIMAVVNGVQKDNFNRMKINIINDCVVLYKYAGTVFKIIFDETGSCVADIIPA